jgi:hypothetical protein
LRFVVMIPRVCMLKAAWLRTATIIDHPLVDPEYCASHPGSLRLLLPWSSTSPYITE